VLLWSIWLLLFMNSLGTYILNKSIQVRLWPVRVRDSFYDRTPLPCLRSLRKLFVRRGYELLRLDCDIVNAARNSYEALSPLNFALWAVFCSSGFFGCFLAWWKIGWSLRVRPKGCSCWWRKKAFSYCADPSPNPKWLRLPKLEVECWGKEPNYW
jgi:hypothetical protein